MAKATLELKYKRLKVGHACYVCRSKKIKCDGLRPCMQCKARGRTCESSNIEAQENNEDHLSTTTVESDNDSILFSTSDNMATTQETCSETNMSFFDYPRFGSSIQWKQEPPLPSKYSCPIEMPSGELQMQMIDLFFRKRHRMLPILPKSLFYEQLRLKGPLITPLLLNAIYCDVSSFAPHCGFHEVPKPSVFFNRAKKLLDDFLDRPRISTVVALCLLSMHEPNPTKLKSTTANQHCRLWMYGGMAARMCLELGLNIDTPRTRGMLSEEEIELRRRVLWSCYFLDKTQSMYSQRPWSLSSSSIKTQLPSVLCPGDQEEAIITQFQHNVKLFILYEQGLRIHASYGIFEDISKDTFMEQIEKYRLKILQWGVNLPIHHDASVQDVINEPTKLASTAFLQLFYYFMLADILACLPQTNTTHLEERIYASQMVKCVESLLEDPSMVPRYQLLIYALTSAVRIHARFLRHLDTQVSQQSRQFYNQSMSLFQKIQKYASIPECATVLQHMSAYSEQENKTTTNNTTTQPLSPPEYALPMDNSVWNTPQDMFSIEDWTSPQLSTISQPYLYTSPTSLLDSPFLPCHSFDNNIFVQPNDFNSSFMMPSVYNHFV